MYAESKVLQYFGNVRDNSAAPSDFAKFVKVTTHTGLFDSGAWSTALELTVLVYLIRPDRRGTCNRCEIS